MFKVFFLFFCSVWLIGLISLVNDSVSEMMYLFILLYLSGVLMVGLWVLGLIEGVVEVIVSLFKFWVGVMVDCSGCSKFWIIGGYGLVGLVWLVIVFVGNWLLLLVLCVVDCIGKVVWVVLCDVLLVVSILLM